MGPARRGGCWTTSASRGARPTTYRGCRASARGPRAGLITTWGTLDELSGASKSVGDDKLRPLLADHRRRVAESHKLMLLACVTWT